MNPLTHEVGKYLKAYTAIVAAVVTLLQGQAPTQVNWVAVVLGILSFLSGATFISVMVMIFRTGQWKGTIDTQISNLQEEVRTIDKEGCGAARRLHGRDPGLPEG